MTSKTIISMQKAVTAGLVFEQWWKEVADRTLDSFDGMSRDRAKIEYSQTQDAAAWWGDKKRKATFIVVGRSGWPPDRMAFVLHHTEAEAAAHGKAKLGAGNFIIRPWSQFKTTAIHHQMERAIASYKKIFRNRKPKK